MAGIIFRKASDADLMDIVRLLADDPLGRTREVLTDPPDPRYRAAFAAIAADPNQLLAVADDAGAVAGCMQLTFVPGLSRTGLTRGQIESVRIAAGYRGAGLGRQFFEWAFERFRERGCAIVQVTSDKSRTEALRFYRSLGFEASHEGLKKSL